MPLGTTEKLLVSPEFVRYLVDVANEKMEANRKRTEGFFRALRQSDGFAGPEVSAAFVGSIDSVCNEDADLEEKDGDPHSGNLIGNGGLL